MSVLFVTGTGTDVGKTIVVAALASLALERQSSVSVVKVAQTGFAPGEASDLDEVWRLSGLSANECFEPARYDEPLAPAAAARLSGRPPVSMTAVATLVSRLAASHDLVLVEGAGGLLVRYDEEGATVADLAREVGAPLLVVTAAGLGTLNATALTLEAMAHRGLELAGLVIGSWPNEPDLAARSNIRDLEMLSARPLSGAVPEGAGQLDRADFVNRAPSWLAPAYGGRFDSATFRDQNVPEDSR
jgi:dethiobiotin synthetase